MGFPVGIFIGPGKDAQIACQGQHCFARFPHSCIHEGAVCLTERFFIDNGKTIGYLFCLQRDGIGAAYARSLHIPQVMHGTGADRQILSGIAMYYKPEELVGKTLVAIVNLPPPQDDGAGKPGHAD